MSVPNVMEIHPTGAISVYEVVDRLTDITIYRAMPQAWLKVIYSVIQLNIQQFRTNRLLDITHIISVKKNPAKCF